jgi:hypothetical protein
MKKIFEQSSERGESKLFLILTVVFGLLMLGLGGGFFWAYTQMNEYKNDVDGKISVAVDAAKTEQKETLTKQFDEDYKKPHDVFTGPANYGSVSFEYPKTWSVYVENDGSDAASGYTAYFNPKFVSRISDTTPYALRVVITNVSFQDATSNIRDAINSGAKLTATNVRLTDASDDPSSNYGKGLRIDGQFRETINGSAVYFDIRGRTLEVFTDHQSFMNDYNNIILKTLKYND